MCIRDRSWLLPKPKLHTARNQVFLPSADVWVVQLLLDTSGYAQSTLRSKLVPEAVDGLACSKRVRVADGNTISSRIKIFFCLLHQQ